MKDHEIAALVNELRDIAISHHASGQLRERIAHAIVPLLKSLNPVRQPVGAGDGNTFVVPGIPYINSRYATQATSAPVAPDERAAFEAWKGYELPALNNHGQFHQDWLHREFVAFKAGQARAALSVKAEECTWTPTADNWETGAWDSSCGETWLLTDGGTPAEHNVKFCQGCGKPVTAPTPPTTGEA